MKIKGFTLIELIIVLAIIGIVACVLIPGLAGVPCKMQWSESGMPYKYSFFGGCKVSTDGGKTWIPDSKYRKTDK